MKQKKAGKRFLSILLTTGMLFGALPAAVFAAGEQSLPFTDVKEADWFYDSVQYVYENQMMSGTGDDVFTPDAATTRGMIVTILYRMEGNPATDSDAKFTDVSAGQYYAEAAAWANEKNIVNGYGSGAFGPNDPITREQMAAVLYRYAKLKGYHTAAAGNLVGFADAGDVSVYAVDPAKWAVGNGLISGVGNNMLAPGASSTRAQIAVILTRFCKNIIPSGPVDPSDSVIYENRDLGFAIEFPNTWEDSYSVEANRAHSSGVIVKTEWGGILCFISRVDTEKWAESVKNDLVPVEYRVLGENSEYAYVLYFASDVNYEGEEQAKIYREMRQDLFHIGFKIL